ncbi:hypothetical protein CBR_g19954 [Chara braunii]|uniref:Reverse transcriptase n=1 Tax=Chara braunii TaxID=69332 RepID=A0A388KZ60_CHABU|nr:hypothetical protein CBR_g19954 [Chara braunii]|eukprot:GBG75321.1 hypothetical protein CBR_g19954 [Chara braunii]
MASAAQQSSQAGSSGAVGSVAAQTQSQSAEVMASQSTVLSPEEIAIQQAALQEAQLQKALGEIKAKKERMIRRVARMQRREADVRQLEEMDLTNMDADEGSLDGPVRSHRDTGPSNCHPPRHSAESSLAGWTIAGGSITVRAWCLARGTSSSSCPTGYWAAGDAAPAATGAATCSPESTTKCGTDARTRGAKTAIAAPKPFSGDKRGEDLDTWLRAVPVYVKFKLTLPHKEVLVATSYLEGSAARWLSGLVQLQGYGHGFCAWAANQKLDDFLKLVEERWHDPREAQKATDAILTLSAHSFKSVKEATDAVELLFVPKKGGTLRMCIDYRGLNAITVKNGEPLPRIDDLLDRVQGCRYFNKIDLKFGYHQIAIRPEDQHKTAFQTRYGLYEFVVMPFGLCNAPGTFQHAMNRIFHDYLDKFVIVYLDDVRIFSRTVEEHVAQSDKVLSLLRQHKFKINGEKCEFGRTRILYLGHEISADGLKPDDAKVASIHDWPWPKLRPVEYMSKKMSSQKLAKSTYEKEIYAVYKALTHWRHYFLGRFFILRTDHQTLRWMRTQPVLSDALKRWIEVIEQYDFDPQYLKGEYNKVADALSRRPDFSSALITEFDLTDDVTRSLVEAYREDQFMSEIIHRLEAKDKKTSAEFELVNGLLFLEKAGNKRLCVPNRESLRSLFLGECHDVTDHFGYKKTATNLLQRFLWPTMMRDAQLYVETCQVCQRDKPRTQAPLGLLKPLPIPERLGESLSMDFMDTLVTSKSGMRHIFVIVDRFSKYARLVAMPETAKTEYVIKLFKENWVRDFGLPKSIVSDRDVRFTSELWKAAAVEQGTQLQMTSGNHPEANGQAEQLNLVVQHLLRHYIKPNQVDWDETLALIASLYNNVVHSATRVSPNSLLLTFKPRLPLDFLLPENQSTAAPGTLEFAYRYEQKMQQAVEQMQKAQAAMIESENKHRRPSTFQVGDRVWVKSSELGQEYGISRKLMPQYFGPWEVLDVVGTDLDGPSYVVRIPGHLRTYPVFHTSKLAPFKETNEFPSRRSMLPPTMDGEVDIDDIVDHRELPVPRPTGRGCPPKPKLQYRVRFRHHTDPKEDCWFTREELMQTALQVVAHYKKSQQKGKRPMVED